MHVKIGEKRTAAAIFCCTFFVAFQKELGSQKITELSAVFRSTSSTLVLRRALPFPEFQKPHLLSHRYSFWLVGGVATQNNGKIPCYDFRPIRRCSGSLMLNCSM